MKQLNLTANTLNNKIILKYCLIIKNTIEFTFTLNLLNYL